MELWSQVIVEWINCLGILSTAIKNVKEVQSHNCYVKLISLLSWKNKDISGNSDVVTRFIKDEYPEFELESKEEHTDNIHIGSLLLLYVSQESIFHRPMCVKLHHDTQIKIKTFLEMVLPYGKNITMEILSEALAELNGPTPKTPCMTPRTQSLKEFLNTPASRSAYSHKKMLDYNRELRRLKAELETERFEKSELQLDLESQQQKIEGLEKKLKDKALEMKLLREEQMKPVTPQSCKKHKNLKHYEDICRKEVDRLEQELLQQQCEINKIEEEKECVSKQLASSERQHAILKKKCADFESSVESLLIQIEYRDKELIDLRMSNDDLRTHLDGHKKTYVIDESSEFDFSLLPPSPRTGEVLSTVIDLQLQEVRIESDRLKEQLTTTTEKLRRCVEENERLSEANNTLQDNIQSMRKYVEENAQLKEIAKQNSILEEDIIRLRNTVAVKDELLGSLAECMDENTRFRENEKNILETDLAQLQDAIAAKDELLSSFSESLQKFDSDVHSKLEDLSTKLIQFAERIKKVENLKDDLQKNYESKIVHMSSNSKSLKLEHDKVLLDLQKIKDRQEILQAEASDMAIKVKVKDDTIKSLTSEITNLKADNERLSESLNEVQTLQSLKQILETQIADKQCLLEAANNDSKLKQEALLSLQNKIDQLKNEKDEILKENTSMRDNISKANKNQLKLQSQYDTLSKEKKVLEEKLATNRVRNVKLEKNIAELRTELKKVKATVDSTSLSPDVETLKQEVTRLKGENIVLSEKAETLSKRQPDIGVLKQEVARLKEENILLSKKTEDMSKQPHEEDFSDKLMHVHEKYQQKLEDIKEKMKVAYNEQVTKMNKMQSLLIQNKVENLQAQMEQQCQKHTNEISKYRAHVGELHKQFGNAVQKCLTEQQQKQQALQQLSELRVKFEKLEFDITPTQISVPKQPIYPKLEKNDFTLFCEKSRSIKTTPEETQDRRLSVRSIQTMGNAFKSADEEGEVFDNTYLADMKEGYCLPTHDIDRLSILQQRNSLFLPHLKSSYPAEMQFYPSALSEEEIKTGSVTDDVFNDSLNQSLLPEQKPRRKDRTHPLYKRPGPPTPSKNGGRLSLQCGEHNSPASRILRERNSDRRTTTPRRFRQMFNMRRQDENSIASPKRRISNMFRKNRTEKL